MYAWLNYVEEQYQSERRQDKRKREPSDAGEVSESDSDGDAHSLNVDETRMPHDSTVRNPLGLLDPSRTICRGGTIYVRQPLERLASNTAFASWEQSTTASINSSTAEENDGTAPSPSQHQRKRLGVGEIGGKIRHAWMRQWHGKGTGTNFYIPRITRDRSNNSVRIVWEDEDEEYNEHLRRQQQLRLQKEQESQRSERDEDAYRSRNL